MCNKKENKILLFRTIVALVLASVMISALFLPIFKVGTYEVQTSDEYSGGSFTKYAEHVGIIDIDLFLFIDIGLNFKDIYDIIEIQSLESRIQYLSNEALTLYSEMSATEDEEKKAALKAEVDAIVQKGNEVNDKLNSTKDKFDEARQLEIAEKLQDKDFCKALVLSYHIAENFTDAFIESDTSREKANFATNTTAVLEILLIAVIALCIAGFILSFVINFIIKLLVFVIKLTSKMCDESCYKKVGSFSFVECALTFFALLLFWSIVSSLEIAIGIGLIMMMAVATVGAISLTVFRALLNNKNLVDTLLNVTVCIVAIFLAIFLSLTLLKTDAMYDYKKSSAEYTYVYFLEQATVNGIETLDEMNAVLEQVGKINVKNTVIILSLSVTIAGLLVGAISYFIKQLGKDGEKRPDGQSPVSKKGIAICAVLLVVSLLPSLFGTAYVEKQYDSIEKGNYKILWYSHLTENTTGSIEYNECLTTYTSFIHEIEAVGEKMDFADEEAYREHEKERKDLVDYTWMLGRRLDRTRVDKKNAASMCMAAAVALLVTQFIYTFIMHDSKKKKLIVAEAESVTENDGSIEAPEAEAADSESVEADVPESQENESSNETVTEDKSTLGE